MGRTTKKKNQRTIERTNSKNKNRRRPVRRISRCFAIYRIGIGRMTVGHGRVRDRPEQTTATEDGGSTDRRQLRW